MIMYPTYILHLIAIHYQTELNLMQNYKYNLTEAIIVR